MGIGSKLKKAVRKIIPNELSEIAVAAAPFVAPFNPAIAAAMAGIGGFDQTGRIGKSLKSAALTYALGQGARYIGGAGFQGNPFTSGGAFRGWGSGGFGAGFSSPFGYETGIGKFFAPETANPIASQGPLATGDASAAEYIHGSGTTTLPSGDVYYTPEQLAAQSPIPGSTTLPGGDVYYTPDQLATQQAASTAASTAANASTQVVQGSLQNATGATFKEFMQASVSDKLKLASEWWSGLESKTKWALGLGSAAAALQYLENKALEDDKIDLEKGDLAYKPEYRNIEDINPTVQLSKNGGIIGLANGGEPTMEMDYRGGGFIPVGAKERADDVPARLSKNEFVMTADAVRAAGGGSVDVGAQRMYNLMNQLEAVA
jgi:hypothetical protein